MVFMWVPVPKGRISEARENEHAAASVVVRGALPLKVREFVSDATKLRERVFLSLLVKEIPHDGV